MSKKRKVIAKTVCKEEDLCEEDNVRPPDEIVCDRLIGNDQDDINSLIYNFDAQMEQAVLQSAKEYEEQERFFQELIRLEYKEEMNRRKKVFEDLLMSMKRVMQFDLDVKKVYHIVQPIIESYVGQTIECYQVDNETYDFIFGTLASIRLKHRDSIDDLQKIFRKAST